MGKWYECKIKYRKLLEDDQEKAVNETYLVDALSFTEAEKRITEEMVQYISGEFSITNIKVSNLVEIHPVEDCQYWYKCKVTIVTVDEEKGKEKKSNTYMLVQADNVREAYDNMERALSDMTVDYSMPSIVESPILDVFPFFGDDAEIVNQEAPEGFVPVAESTPVSQEPTPIVEESPESEEEVAE